MRSANQIIEQLDLQPHIEGGYFRRTYCHTAQLEGEEQKGDAATGDTARPLMSSIFYLLSHDSPTGHMHRNRSDIVHYYQGGGLLRYWLLSPEGELSQHLLGWELPEGPQLQLTVPGGFWKASELIAGDWALISEAVSPGFVYQDMTLASAALLEQYPQHAAVLGKLIATGRHA